MGSVRTVSLLEILVVLCLALGACALSTDPVVSTADDVPSISAFFACDDGKTIDATFRAGSVTPPATPDRPPVLSGRVALTLSDGRAMTLPQVISADGARYQSSDGAFEFWTKGHGAFIFEHNQQTYRGCIVVAPAHDDLTQVYESGIEGFSIRYPAGYTVDARHRYEALGPGKAIGGVSLTIPRSMAAGTNLAADTYLSVEEIPVSASCDARMFLEAGSGGRVSSTQTINGTTYSVAVSTGAGAGNRYEETVYAMPFTNPCIAIRYFVHYSVLENYPPGEVRAFDRKSLVAAFDAIRDTLRIQQ